MTALQGIYDNGTIRLLNKAPMNRAKVMVIFPDEELNDRDTISVNEARTIFDKFTGSVDRIIDEKTERQEAIDEKYLGID